MTASLLDGAQDRDDREAHGATYALRVLRLF